MQSIKQEPLYLPDVENNPQPCSDKDLIQRMQNSGGEYWLSSKGKTIVS
jgi:hypothetical protein